tara:strand:- start:972 stop:1475 length:504 start_codon:yes stop_codon:yes gene_type:complete
MIASQKKSFLSEIEGNDPLSDGARAYLCERVKNDYYDFILTKFHEANKTNGLTQADIARRLNLGPDRVSKMLGAPGNWTIDTATLLLLAICREENTPSSRSYLFRPHTNFDGATCMTANSGASTSQRGLKKPTRSVENDTATTSTDSRVVLIKSGKINSEVRVLQPS